MLDPEYAVSTAICAHMNCRIKSPVEFSFGKLGKALKP